MRVLLFVAVLLLASCARDETIYSYGGAGGNWQVQSINGTEFPATASLQFGPNGEVTGQAPCNRFSTRQTVPYPWIDFGPIAATKMACPDLDAEQMFLRVLDRITIGIVTGDVLTLSNDDGDEMVLTRTPPRDG
jgi:heat shock protein HslJ